MMRQGMGASVMCPIGLSMTYTSRMPPAERIPVLRESQSCAPARLVRSTLVGLLLLAPLAAVPAVPSDQLPGSWATAAPASTKRTEVAAAALDGRIYVVGGFEQPGLSNVLHLAITSAVEAYDPATDRWTAKAPLPVGLHHAGIGAVGRRLYVIGGYKQSGLSVWQAVATVYAYDPASDTWTERASMPTARGALAVAVHDGRLYAIGGYDGKANSAAVEVYDPEADQWTARAPLPTPRDHLAAAAVSGKIYAIGGRLKGDYRRNLSVTEAYDVGADRWTRVADLPTARSGITAAQVDGMIYVLGGEGGEGTFDENEAYDPAQDRWYAMAPMPTARHGLGSAAVQHRIHVISGGPSPGGSFSDLNEIFIPPANR